MMHSGRVVEQWVDWKLICVEGEEYLLARRDGFDIDFEAPGDEEAVTEAMRLIREVEGGSTSPE